MPAVLRWLLQLAPTNPITVRLLQTGSRRSRHQYIRIGYLGILIIVLLWALVLRARGDELSFTELAVAGATSFAAIAYLQIALICILAPVFMASAIAQEADPRTWDILLTTPLSASQIVLGNLIGRLLFILALLFSSLPLFAVTKYFGGVPSDTIFASYAIAACAATVVGSSAIALSVSRLVGKRAVFAFYVGVVAFLGVTFAVDRVIGTGGVTHVTALNPFLSLQALLDPTGYPRIPLDTAKGLDRWFLARPVSTYCILSGLLTVFLLVASAITVRIGGIAGAGGLIGRDGGRPRKSMIDDPTARRDDENEVHRAPKSVWANPISWREAVGRAATPWASYARYAFIVLGVIWALVMVYFYHTGKWPQNTFRAALLFTVLAQITTTALVAINLSATSIAKEREDGTLDLLLTTPITPAQYLAGKLNGLVANVLPLIAVPIVTLLIAGGYIGLGALGKPALATKTVTQTVTVATPQAGALSYEIPVIIPEAGIILAIVIVPFLAACIIVGMSWSLRSKSALTSVAATVGLVGVVAGTLGLCGFSADRGLGSLAPVAAALSPASVTFGVAQPDETFALLVVERGSAPIRVGLFIGALISATLHLVVVFILRSHMASTFDMTVRKLAGTK